MTALVDMAGATVNGISVLERVGHVAGRPGWRCRCTCGKTFDAAGVSLRDGSVKGCARCAHARRSASATKHGGVGTREYVCYSAMKQRCNDTANKRYARYGGRGIAVCTRWADSFANFLEDMGPQPSPLHSIERMNSDKNYEPGNCVWATKEVQANNRSNNTRIEIGGRIQTLTQWARETGIHRTVISRRIQRGITGLALIKKGI